MALRMTQEAEINAETQLTFSVFLFIRSASPAHGCSCLCSAYVSSSQASLETPSQTPPQACLLDDSKPRKLEIKSECEGCCVPFCCQQVAGGSACECSATWLSKVLMHFPPLGADAASWGRHNVSLAPVKLCPVLSESFRYFCKAAFSPLFSFMLQCNFLSLGFRYVSHRRKAGRCIKCLAVRLSPPSFHSELTPVLSCTCLPQLSFCLEDVPHEGMLVPGIADFCGVLVPFVHQEYRR